MVQNAPAEECSNIPYMYVLFITPCACARDKVIGSVIVVVVVVDTKIAWSQHLGTWATCKHNEYVEFGEKLALVCSELSGMTYKRHK